MLSTVREISRITLGMRFPPLKMDFSLVCRTIEIEPLMASIGSCCLVGVICRGILYIANLGDSKTVIGSVSRSNKIVAEQLISDNASMEEVKNELVSANPEDSYILGMQHGVWCIKGII